MVDDNHEYTSEDVLTLDDALSLTIIGYRVRAADMPEGTFIDYNFNGFRINHAAGASSGWTSRPHDETVNWHVLDDEHYDAYKRVLAERDKVEPEPKPKDAWGKPSAIHLQQFGRALRSVPPAPVVAKDWALDASKEVLAVPAPTATPSVGNWGKPAMDAMKKVTEQAAQLPEAASKWGKWGKPS